MSEEVPVAAQVLTVWGASVEAVPDSSTEGSDWLAELDGCRLLVEEKSKFDDPAAAAARAAALASGNVHAGVVPLAYNNRISGIVRKAADQLRSTADQVNHDLRIVWFTGVGFDGEAKHHQFMSTLYGSTKVFERDKHHLCECYFFRNSDFYRYKDQLDGAVAAFLSGDTVTVKLCLNPCSPNWQALRDSPYARNFKLGLIDPVAEEARGDAYIVDTDIQRSDEQSVLRYLETKYGLQHAFNMDMKIASAAFSVPR